MKIHNKLFSVFIVFSTVLVISLVSLMQWSIDKGMIEYVNQREINTLEPFIQQLTKIYQQNNNWNSLVKADKKFEHLLRKTLQGSDFAFPRPEKRPPPRFNENNQYDRRRPPRKIKEEGRFYEKNKEDFEKPRKRFSDYEAYQPPRRNDQLPNKKPRPPIKDHLVSYALLDNDKSYITGNYPKDREYSFTPITLDDQIIGFMAVSKRNRLTQGYELDFVEQQKNYLWYISIAVMLLVIMITFPFARHIVAPIRALTKGMHQLTQGQYKSRLENNRKDEFAQLSRDFNELAKTLMENESARKRWLANISHELRTPVAILKGELEAVLDGVRELSIDHVHSAHQEVTHLQRLIQDLHALTSADIGGMSYRKNSLELVNFVKQEANKLKSYLQHEGFELHENIQAKEAIIFADQTRLCQLLENIINNCIKYAKTGTLVSLSLNVDSLEKQVSIIIEDDGIGVEEKHLSLLFEHLYRVEDSRNRESGGSGLGLSICSHIVQAHQGEISAEKSSLGGLAINIRLPLQ